MKTKVTQMADSRTIHSLQTVQFYSTQEGLFNYLLLKNEDQWRYYIYGYFDDTWKRDECLQRSRIAIWLYIKANIQHPVMTERLQKYAWGIVKNKVKDLFIDKWSYYHKTFENAIDAAEKSYGDTDEDIEQQYKLLEDQIQTLSDNEKSLLVAYLKCDLNVASTSRHLGKATASSTAFKIKVLIDKIKAKVNPTDNPVSFDSNSKPSEETKELVSHSLTYMSLQAALEHALNKVYDKAKCLRDYKSAVGRFISTLTSAGINLRLLDLSFDNCLKAIALVKRKVVFTAYKFQMPLVSKLIDWFVENGYLKENNFRKAYYQEEGMSDSVIKRLTTENTDAKTQIVKKWISEGCSRQEVISRGMQTWSTTYQSTVKIIYLITDILQNQGVNLGACAKPSDIQKQKLNTVIAWIRGKKLTPDEADALRKKIINELSVSKNGAYKLLQKAMNYKDQVQTA